MGGVMTEIIGNHVALVRPGEPAGTAQAIIGNISSRDVK
jgi:hypothetical protein